MSKVFSRGVKDLKISAPTSVDQVASKLKCKVILIAKYDFQAESSNELLVKKGDVLKLLDRLTNGWVLVEFIDKMVGPGLVPSTYVDIAVNDSLHPITLLWLHNTSGPLSTLHNTFYDVQVQMLLQNNTPLTINNKAYPLSVSVTDYLMYENRFWYRVDVKFSTGEKGYLCRYYSDFYDLHLALLDHLNSADKPHDDADSNRLPKLPEPVPSNRRDSVEQSDLFSKRCRDLSTYMQTLISVKRYQVSPALCEWLAADFKGLPGFVVEDAVNEPSSVINQRLLPGSVILGSKSKVPVTLDLPADSDKSNDSIKYYAPAKDVPLAPTSKNIYNHYQQAIKISSNVSRSMSTTEQRGAKPTSGPERSKTVSTTRMKAPHTLPQVYKAQFSPGPMHSQFSPPSRTATFPQPGSFSPPTLSHQRPHQPPVRLHSVVSHKYPTTPIMNHTFQETLHGPHKTPLSRGMSARTPNSGKTPNPSKPPTPRSFSSPMTRPQQAPPPIGLPEVQAQLPRLRINTLVGDLSSPVLEKRGICCEVKTQKREKVTIELDEIKSKEDLKTQIYQKIAFNNIYAKASEDEGYEELDQLDDDLVEVILRSKKLSLLVT